MKQLVERFFLTIDVMMVFYWIGFYLYLMMPTPCDCCCDALIEVPSGVSWAFDSLYDILHLVWFSAFWVMVRFYYHFLKLKRYGEGGALYFLLGLQAFFQTFFVVLVSMSLITPERRAVLKEGEWIEILYENTIWFPASVAFIIVDRLIRRCWRKCRLAHTKNVDLTEDETK